MLEQKGLKEAPVQQDMSGHKEGFKVILVEQVHRDQQDMLVLQVKF